MKCYFQPFSTTVEIPVDNFKNCLVRVFQLKNLSFKNLGFSCGIFPQVLWKNCGKRRVPS
jgi:hypothetical protein